MFSAGLAREGLECGVHELGVTVSDQEETNVRATMAKMAGGEPMDPLELAAHVANINAGKYGEQVPVDLARAIWARQNADIVSQLPLMAAGLLDAR